MKNKKKAELAIIAVFPTAQSFKAFAENKDNHGIMTSFLQYASQHDLIKSQETDDLLAFIQRNGLSDADCLPPDNLNFEGFLKKKEELLGIKLSGRVWTDRINQHLKDCQINLPGVSNSMLSRLKKENADTNHKQNVLRSIAFWLGHDRQEPGLRWNYETLLRLCRKSKALNKNLQEGVRTGFAFYSRGDVIDHEIVEWLRQALKQYLEKSMGYFPRGRWGKVKSHDITTLYIDFPKEESEGDPAAYRTCLRGAVSLAHQISIRWALSSYCTKNRFLSIGIAAGEFALLDNYLLPILNARLPGDPVIRVTDYARQCLLINDIRAFLCRKPQETTLFNGETLTIWWIVAFWNMLYFDFIPELIEDETLKSNPASIKILTRLLFYPGTAAEDEMKKNMSNPIIIFFSRPHDCLLGLEIAKTLYYRRLFREALEILRIVLSTDPADLTARTLRLVLLRELALQAPSLNAFKNLILQAEEEALYVEATAPWQSEDFYCEYAILHLVKALHSLRWLRQTNDKKTEKGNIPGRKKSILNSLDKAESLFRRGMAVSPSAIRTSYLLNSLRVLKAVLCNADELFIDPEKSLNGNPDVIAQPSIDMAWEIGISRPGQSQESQYEFLVHMLKSKEKIHDDSIALDTYRPSTLFAHAVVLWDFMSIHTVATVKRALSWLNAARNVALRASDKGLCIYSFTRIYGEIMTVDVFVQHIDRSIRMIEQTAGADLYKREDDYIIPMKKNKSSLLMTLNF